MKRWLISILAACGLFILIVYAALPAQVKVQQVAITNASSVSNYRALTDIPTIQKWWKGPPPSHTPSTPAAFLSRDWRYQFKPLMFNGAEVLMAKGNKTLQSVIVITPLEKDSSLLEWKVEWPKTQNPFQRLQNFWQAQQVKKNMEDILHQYSTFIDNPETFYGLHIEKTKVNDTIIITTKKVFPSYPAPSDYYPMIESLQKYIKTSGAQATNYPMLNIRNLQRNGYGVMVGIPVNKELPGLKDIELKRMIPGNILVAEITGGPDHIEASMQEMQNYIKENDLMPPAIPFQSLVTDRKAEPDTNHWVTKLYFPVY